MAAPRTIQSWMGAVGQIARAVNEAASLDSILNDVAERSCSLLSFDHCAIMLAEPGTNHVTVAGSYGLKPGYVALVSDGAALAIHPPDASLDSPAGHAFREQVTVTVSDTATASPYGRLSSLAPAQGYRSLLATPLRSSEDCFGILVGYLRRPHTFSAQDIELAELLADQTAIAIRTAELRASQQETIAELREHRAVRDWADRQHRRLMHLVLDDVRMDGLVEALADMLDADVLVEDGAGGVLARTSDEDFRVAEPEPPPSAPSAAPESVGYEAVRVAEGPDRWVAPVMLGSELAGRLWVCTRGAGLEPGQKALTERFSVVVGTEILKRRHVLEVEERLSGDLLGDLLRADGISQPRSVLDRAAALGHDLAEPHWLAVLMLHGDEPMTPALTRLVCDAARTSTALAGRYEDHVVLLLPHTRDPIETLVRLQGVLGRRRHQVTASTLLSHGVCQLHEYARAYALVSGVARLRRRAARGGVVDLRRLEVTSLLMMNGTPPRTLGEFAVDLLAPVRAHDDRKHSELLATLRAWLAHGCSPTAAATELVVHVNTVTYRLGRAEELLGRKLRHPDTRLELQLAVHVSDILTLSE